MSDRALRRFLGASAASDDRALLGIPPASAPTAEAIQSALSERLSRIDRHPDRDGADASIARGLVRDAAARLAAAAARGSPNPAVPGAAGASPSRTPPRPPAGHPMARAASVEPHRPPVPRRPEPAVHERSNGGPPPSPQALRPPPPPRALTPFDRMVLATLVSGGGWNAISRQRLVALAASRGVGVDGLVKVVSGLAQHVRRGGVRPGMRDMTEGAALLLADRQASPPSRLETIVDHLAQAVGQELRSERLVPRIRVTVAFALVTLALLAILVKVMLSDSTRPGGQADATAPGASAPLASPGAESGPPPGVDAARESIGAGERDGRPAGAVQPARFPQPPTFAGAARPAAALELLERAAGLPALIETLGRRIAIGDEATSAAVDREWALAIDEMGGCWPLMDRAARQRTIAAFVEALRAADVPALADRFVGALQRGPASSTGAPASWNGAFRTGLLGEIMARGAVLPPTVVERAGLALRQTLVEPIAGGAAGFDDAAGRWLDRAVESMIARLPANPDFGDEWEQWIVAQRAARGGEALQRAFADAAGALLRSGLDVGAPGPASDVLGRFVQMLEFNDTPAVRSALLRWFDDPRIHNDALWVLTSLMHRKGDIRWFGGDLLLDWNAPPAARAAVAESIASRWPAPTAPAVTRRPMIGVANDALEQWVAALRLIEARATAGRDPAASVRTTLLTAMINEAAAAFEAGQDERAREIVATVRAALAPEGASWPHRGTMARPARGVASGVDGEFADAYEQSERNTEQRLGLLRQLRLRGGGDLGPRDAEALVRAATRGTPPEARSVARGVLVEAFARGPNAMLELLDQLPEIGPSDELGQVISQIADATIPPARSPDWSRAARLALIRHVLLLRDDVAVDADAALLAETMLGRLNLATGGGTTVPPGSAPQQVLARVVDAWRRRAGSTIAGRPTPAPLAELDRRRALRDRLARGAIVSLVAEQIAQLELAAYVIAATAPWLEQGCREVVDAAAAERGGAQTATGQAVATELALARLWELALVGDPGLASASRGLVAPLDAGAPAPATGASPGTSAGPSPSAPATNPPSAGADQRRPPRPPIAPPSVEQPSGIKPPGGGRKGGGTP